MQLSELQKLSDLDVDVRSGRGHIYVHMWSRSTHTHEIRSKSGGRMDGSTYGWTDVTGHQKVY